MPIPKLSGKMTRQEIIDAYAQMQWYKNLEFDWVEMNGRTGQPFKKRYRFIADTMACGNPNCTQHQMTFVQLKPTGVMWTCAICRRTEGPRAWEDGRLMNSPGTVVNLSEAHEIIRKTGQKMPIGLPPVTGSNLLEIVG